MAVKLRRLGAPPEEQTRLNGARACGADAGRPSTVLDPETMQPVPADGETMGEMMFRGNT